MIKIPIGAVPVTLQTLFVMLSGSMLGAELGALSQLEYLILGLFGLPVFSGGGGVAYVTSPTFGYLLGFVPAAGVIGRIIEVYGSSRLLTVLLANLAGIIVIYAFGLPVLYLNLKYLLNKPVGFTKILWTGGLLFIPFDIAKAVICSLLVIKLRNYRFLRTAGEIHVGQN